MSGTVESRIVTMKFDSSDFNSRIGTTLNFLDRLKQSLNFHGSTKGMQDVQSTANKMSFAPLATTIQGASAKFLALSTVGITVLSGLVTKAASAGAAMVKSLSLQPVMDGLREYELKLNSIQTILANTQASGATLKDVSGKLQELNKYSDQTIYNFGQMAKNIGTFTAAGVDLDTATGAIKGIANLAALSGSNADQASTAMYQLSQAISSGKVSLMDWNSVVNAGMGGSVFQRALAQTAVAMDKLPASALKLEGSMKNVKINGKSFRESISAEGGGPTWLTSDVLTTALKNFTGDMKEADLVAQGFSKTQAKTIMQQAAMARDAATVVKSGTQLVGVLKEAAGSGWAQTWELIIGDFEEAKKLWTEANNVFSGMINASADARNKVLGDWKKLGGRTVLIEGIKAAFQALMSVLKPIQEAFRDIFPRKTGKDLYDLTVRFRDFMKSLKISELTAINLRRTFQGVFALFSIGKQVIQGIFAGFKRLFELMGGGQGSFLDLTARLGGFLVMVDAMMLRTGVVETFFKGFAEVVSIPLKMLQNLASAIAHLFDGFDGGGAEKAGAAVDTFTSRMAPLTGVAEKIQNLFSKIGDAISSIGDVIGEAMVKVSAKFGDLFTAEMFGSALDAINTGLLAGIYLMFKKFLSGGVKVDVGGGMFAQIKEALGGVTETLGAMQAQIKSNAILKIAGALALLTASIVVLSMIDSKALAKALVAIAVGFVGMQMALTSMANAIGLMGAAKLPLITTALIGLGAGLLLMATALKILASIDPEDTGRSLLNMGAMLLITVRAMKSLSKDVGGMVRAAGAMLILGTALNVMAVALKLFATMSWSDMAHGLTALAGALTVIIVAMRLMPKDMVLQAAALTILSVALNAIGAAMLIFNTMSWNEMSHGLVALAGALVIIAGAMHIMPKGMVFQAAALVAVGVALNIIAGAMKVMGSMGWEAIGKGMVVLAGSLAILAIALNSMTGAIFGAAALVVAAGALALLAPILITLGSLEWSTIIKGLTTLAGIFVILGAAGFILAPIVPVLIGLGAALVLVGAGLALAGVGALAFGTAFGIVVAAGAASITVLSNILTQLVGAIPAALAAVGAGIVLLAEVIGKAGPQFLRAFSTILSSILNAIILNVPKFGQAFLTLISTGVKVIVRSIPMIANGALKLLLGFLQAINNNIYRIVAVVGSIIVKFLDSLARQLPKIIDSGVRLIISFINGISKAIDEHAEEMGEAGGRLAVAIVKGMAKGILAGQGEIADAAKSLAKNALKSVGGFLGIHSPSREFFKIGKYSSQGMANGLIAFAQLVGDAASEVGSAALTTIKSSMSRLSDAISGDVNMTPVIAPVIDLTQFRKDAGQMAGMLDTSSINASVSYSQASSVSSAQQAAREIAAEQGATSSEPSMIKFEQTINSPEALSTIEIYRQSQNLLSQAKKVLSVPA